MSQIAIVDDVVQRISTISQDLKPGQKIVVSVVDESGSKVMSPPMDVELREQASRQLGGELVVDPAFGALDCDTLIFLKHFREPAGATVLEVGANESYTADILAQNGYKVLGVDLRARNAHSKHPHLEGDFVRLAQDGLLPTVDAIYSTSAIEHFGLPVYGFASRVEDYDAQAMDAMLSLLRPGGNCYITVPYGREFLEDGDWRVYCKQSIRDRIIRGFQVEEEIFFLSGGCSCPDHEGIVSREDADAYSGKPPHVTILLALRKQG